MENKTGNSSWSRIVEFKRFTDSDWKYAQGLPDKAEQEAAGYIGCMKMEYDGNGSFRNRWVSNKYALGLSGELADIVGVLRQSETYRDLWIAERPYSSPSDNALRIKNWNKPEYTVHADAGDYTYLMRSSDSPRTLDVIIYCYEREKLERHMQGGNM